MNTSVLQHWRTSPMLVRLVPFAIFVGCTALQGSFGEASRYWVYAAKTVLGGALLWLVWPWISEMRWKVSWEAVLVGMVVFALWVGLDGLYPSLEGLVRLTLCPVLRLIGFEEWCAKAPASPNPWNPHGEFSAGMAWGLALARLLGSTLVVPPLEEVFYRSFLYRYIAKAEFHAMPLNEFRPAAFFVTALIFGLAHYEWLPGILCGVLYQGLVLWKGRLGDAMTAHAITNFLLGLWVISKGAWHFW